MWWIHFHLDISTRVRTVKLIYQVEHSPLNFVVPTNTIVETGSANSIHFVKEYETSFLRSGHFEQFSRLHHWISLRQNKNDIEKLIVCKIWLQLPLRHISDQVPLTRMKQVSVWLANAWTLRVLPVPRGPKKKNSLRWLNAKIHESLRLLTQ